MKEFEMPVYNKPDFSAKKYVSAPDVRCSLAEADGVVPEGFYATTIYPEYFKLAGKWKLIERARMDCVVVIRAGRPVAVEARYVKRGEHVVVGRTDDCSEGIYINYDAFTEDEKDAAQAFAFRSVRSRETSSSRDYDELCALLDHEREHGYVVWVLGPAVDFDQNGRATMARLIREGYVDAIFAGNALGTHDLEAALFHTALGQDIYTRESVYNGHYHHLEAINRVRRAGSVENLIRQEHITDGILAACVEKGVPFVLAGSIRDDGPLPCVIGDVYDAQKAMREHTTKATTVISLATQLHSIATGNMTPTWRLVDGVMRPVYIYSVDVSEFALNKLHDRGSLSVKTLVTNAQDFLSNVKRGLAISEETDANAAAAKAGKLHEVRTA